jgi:uncharacterized protein (DUF488 family)
MPSCVAVGSDRQTAPPRLLTIGVYGWAWDTFLAALRAAGAAQVLDVRQRRGVRGSEYAWANAKRLEAALTDAGVGYEHRPELAPTTELRQLQYAEDDRVGVGKRSRTELAPAYVAGYTAEVLEAADLDALADVLGRGTAALLCVERDPEACHRALAAERIAARYGLELVHLRPGV